MKVRKLARLGCAAFILLAIFLLFGLGPFFDLLFGLAGAG